jgi:hypothetical protein
MTDNIVVFTNEFFTSISARLYKFAIAMLDNTALIGRRYQAMMCWKLIFFLGNWLIVSHSVLSPCSKATIR